MRWTCPKCGKKLDISNEQLIANDGVIVCPQCLMQSRQPIPTARVAAKLDEASRATQSPPPRKTSKENISFDSTGSSTTPPPHHSNMSKARTSYRYTGTSGSTIDDQGNPRPGTKKKTTKKKKKKKKSQGMSGWGCFGRTIVFTLVLFAAYVILGLFIEALQ